MRIQRRITLGIGILFTMILLLGIQSVGYVRQLSRATGTILADNYNSLQYAGEMLRSLNDIGQDSISRHALRENLALQQQNITEISEKETTAALERHVASLSDPVTEAEIRTVREDLFRIMELNMAAIRAKSAGVEQRADYAMWWLIAVAALCALIAGGILVWFPQSVLRPINALKKGITQIANHNYRERLDFPGNREFESVAESFNDMAAKLDEYRRSSLDDLMTAKKRIEAIVDTLHEPIVGLGPDRRILFMNREAFSVLNLREDAVGRDAAEVALSNDLLRRLVRGVNDTEKDADKEPLKIYADNKESYFQVENTPLYITPVGGREQQFVGNLIVLNNVTRFKELDSAKTNFISTVSHEMKTPISSILMSLQLLGDDRLGTLNGEQKQLVTSIKESSDRLLSITGELLNMTQIETSRPGCTACASACRAGHRRSLRRAQSYQKFQIIRGPHPQVPVFRPETIRPGGVGRLHPGGTPGPGRKPSLPHIARRRPVRAMCSRWSRDCTRRPDARTSCREPRRASGPRRARSPRCRPEATPGPDGPSPDNSPGPRRLSGAGRPYGCASCCGIRAKR